MDTIEDEAEIKVEYYESFDKDPLRENNQKTTLTETDNTKNNIASSENINECEIFENSNSGHDIPVNNENNDIVEPDKELKWYRLINDFGRYICRFCDLAYSTVQTLRNHVRQKHNENYYELKNRTVMSLRKKKLKCHICKKYFKCTKDLKVHVEEHGLDNMQKSCYVCHATFEGTKEMLNHVKNEHNLLKKNKHFCSTCGYSTAKLSHFKQHENTHMHGIKQKCPFCEYSTNYLPNLKIHQQTHSNDKSYICDFDDCDYCCRTKSVLNSHKLKHNRKKNILYCDKCPYNTVYKQSLKKHIDRHNRNSIRRKVIIFFS